MAKPTLKCGRCKQDTPRESVTKVGSTNYCPTCLEEKNKPKEMTDWDYLYQYILECTGVEKLSGLTFKKLKEYRDDYEYTDIGMYYTLKYIHETLGLEVYDNGHLGQIPFYYQQAKEHVVRTYELQDMVDNFEFQEETIKVKVSGNSSWSQKKELDLGTIDWEEDIDEDE